MTLPDLVNGLFELLGGVLIAVNCMRLYRDKVVRGVNVWVTVFFTSWGFSERLVLPLPRPVAFVCRRAGHRRRELRVGFDGGLLHAIGKEDGMTTLKRAIPNIPGKNLVALAWVIHPVRNPRLTVMRSPP